MHASSELLGWMEAASLLFVSTGGFVLIECKGVLSKFHASPPGSNHRNIQSVVTLDSTTTFFAPLFLLDDARAQIIGIWMVPSSACDALFAAATVLSTGVLNDVNIFR